MKYLITLLTITFTLIAFNANSQSLSIGSDNIQLGVSQNSIYTEATHTQNTIGIFNTKISAGVGIVQEEKETFISNGNSRTFNGVTRKSANFAFMPSVMVGVNIPFYGLNLGFYSGYKSYINSSVKHTFVPVSVSIWY